MDNPSFYDVTYLIFRPFVPLHLLALKDIVDFRFYDNSLFLIVSVLLFDLIVMKKLGQFTNFSYNFLNKLFSVTKK